MKIVEKIITDEQIREKAREEAQKNILDYSPYSYREGFADGAMWLLKQLQHGRDLETD